ncbi:MAG: hypothetical protein QGG17_00820 [Rhodospirillales bacterium]|jgi:hypothetical protein|nr:hypothetical protein [Rhodospirillales bacterium]MDP6805542.1 hypothetical protein [Rhodospirillales bacterium]
MTDSRIDRRTRWRGAGLFVGVLAIIGAGPAVLAQDGGSGETTGGPLLLRPPATSPSPVGPAGEAEPVLGAPAVAPVPGRARTFPDVPANQSPVREGATGVDVNALRTIHPDSSGALSLAGGGFGVETWKGTPRPLADALMARLPVGTTSPAMRALMRRLLLSAATPPEGEAAPGSFLALRAKSLAAMGDLGGVNALLEAIPSPLTNDELVRIEADSRFLANDNARACTLAAGQIGLGDSPYWQKAYVFCQALADQHDMAALGVALMRDAGELDVAFFALVDALSVGHGVVIENLPDASPLHLAMARAAKAQLPADVVASNRPGVLQAVATSPNAPVELRLEAAERAEAAGALTVETLRQLYTSVAFSEDELANPLSKTEAETGPLSRALLYRTALVQTVPTAKAEVVVRALELGREGDRYSSTVRTFLPVIHEISPSTVLVWFAPEAIRAFLSAGEHESALDWHELLRGDAMFNPNSAAIMNELAVLILLAGLDERAEGADPVLERWWRGEGDAATGDAAVLFTLFESLGAEVPTPLWEELLMDAPLVTAAIPSPAHWSRQAAAAQSGRVGETVLLALLSLGEGGPGQANPVVLGHVLRSLVAIGLENEARAIAVEAALATGL